MSTEARRCQSSCPAIHASVSGRGSDGASSAGDRASQAAVAGVIAQCTHAKQRYPLTAPSQRGRRSSRWEPPRSYETPADRSARSLPWIWPSRWGAITIYSASIPCWPPPPLRRRRTERLGDLARRFSERRQLHGGRERRRMCGRRHRSRRGMAGRPDAQARLRLVSDGISCLSDASIFSSAESRRASAEEANKLKDQFSPSCRTNPHAAQCRPRWADIPPRRPRARTPGARVPRDLR